MEDTVRTLFRKTTGREAASVKRFTVGLCHYVFRVTAADGGDFVFRLAASANREILKGGLYWLRRLEPLALPIPRVLHDGTDDELPFLILTFLPGADLGIVYASLSEREKQGIAAEVCAIQETISILPPHRGYGFLRSYEEETQHGRWQDVVERHLEQSLAGIRQNKIFDGALVAPVKAMLPGFSGYFASIRPQPFLDDATTKNVLVDRGRLSGIVDIDQLCFGDRLYCIALTRMSLLQCGYDTTYIGYLAGCSTLNQTEMRMLDFYTLVFCLDFMAEIGQTFNKEEPLAVSESEKERMLAVYHQLLEKLGSG